MSPIIGPVAKTKYLGCIKVDLEKLCWSCGLLEMYVSKKADCIIPFMMPQVSPIISP